MSALKEELANLLRIQEEVSKEQSDILKQISNLRWKYEKISRKEDTREARIKYLKEKIIKSNPKYEIVDKLTDEEKRCLLKLSGERLTFYDYDFDAAKDLKFKYGLTTSIRYSSKLIVEYDYWKLTPLGVVVQGILQDELAIPR